MYSRKKSLNSKVRRPRLPRGGNKRATPNPETMDFAYAATVAAFGMRHLHYRDLNTFQDASPVELAQRRAAMEDRRSKKKPRKSEKPLTDLFEELGVAL